MFLVVPPNHPFAHRVFHYFHHPFWGMFPPIFGSTPKFFGPGFDFDISDYCDSFETLENCLGNKRHGRFDMARHERCVMLGSHEGTTGGDRQMWWVPKKVIKIH